MDAISTDRMICEDGANANLGRVRWSPVKSVWTMSMLFVAVLFGPMTATADAIAVFIVLTFITICCGHSVGMHRLLIHRSFRTPVWLEHVLVYLGTLVGMAGPFGMIYAHDIRDWAQRQSSCHDLFAHKRPFFHDAWWQMHCHLALTHPPRFVIEPQVRNDRFYRFLERTWIVQQLPLALVLFALGGWAWVIWGIAVRVTVSLTGHWLIGHLAHRRGSQIWRVDGVAVQGYNVPYAGLVTFGEAYHGNHHAYPSSARMGLAKGQIDLGWWLICGFKALGLATDVATPATLEPRKGLVRVDGEPGAAQPVPLERARDVRTPAHAPQSPCADAPSTRRRTAASSG